MRALSEDAQRWVDRLRAAMSAGTAVDVDEGVGGRLDVDASQPWPADRWIPADAVRAALLDPPEDCDPYGLRITGGWIDGRLDLDDADIPTTLVLIRCVLPAGLSAVRAHLHHLTLNGSHATTLGLAGARIDGDLNLTGTTLDNPTGYALALDGATIGGSLRARGGFTATGEVRALGATITGALVLVGATLSNPDGDALALDGASIGGGLFAGGGFTATGEVRAPGATITGQLDLTEATLTNPTGNALNLDRASIGGSLLARDGFTATGTVRAPGATITGQLDLTGATLTNPTGNALTLDGASIGRLWLGGCVVREGRVNLISCEIGDLVLNHDHQGPPLPALASATGWRIRDIHGAIRTDRRIATAWLDTAPRFTAQPWEELARVYDRNGQPATARRLRFHAAHRTTFSERRHHRFAFLARGLHGLTTGYGYYPLTAIVWLLACIGIAGGVTAQHLDRFVPTVATARATTVHNGTPTPPPGCPDLTAPLTADTDPTCRVPGYPDLNPLSYAVTTVTPASALAPPAWTPTASWLDSILTALKLTGWILTTLFLAGITGLLRKG